jgi:hypothetical protein
MTKEGALRRLEQRTEQLLRLEGLGAPEVILDNQRLMVTEARMWVEDPPVWIPD